MQIEVVSLYSEAKTHLDNLNIEGANEITDICAALYGDAARQSLENDLSVYGYIRLND